MEETKANVAVPKTDKPATTIVAVAVDKPAVSKYRYLGPANAERLVIPGTVVPITLAHLNDVTIEGLLKQHPGMARLYELI